MRRAQQRRGPRVRRVATSSLAGMLGHILAGLSVP